MKSQKILLFLATIMMSAMLTAQGTPQLELSISEQKVNMTIAEKSGKASIAYRPGDVIHYQITAENTGDGVMTNPVVSDPIPEGVVYLPLTAKGRDAQVQFSIDSGKSYQSWPPVYLVKDENGNEIRKEATADMVTHIRWNIRKPLAPKEKRLLEFDVMVK